MDCHKAIWGTLTNRHSELFEKSEKKHKISFDALNWFQRFSSEINLLNISIVNGVLSDKLKLEEMSIGDYYSELYSFYQLNKEKEKQLEKNK